MLTNFLGSSFLIIAVFVIRALFARGTSRRFIYALWLIVLVRLLMPMPIFDLGIEIPLPISHDVGTTADRETYYPPITAENPEISQIPTTEIITPPQPVSPQPVEKNIDWAKVFDAIHITGAGSLALWFGYVNISLYTRLKKDRVKLETSHNLPVYKTNVLTTPCLFGVIKPAIYLTEAACDERHINNVITHEMCHYRHWDNLWNFLGMVCVVMWWWSPLVWLSFFTAKRDGELACDELALEILGENGSRNYGVTLIEMAKNRPHHRLSMAATISGGAKEMKERIMAIANKRKNVLWAVAVVAVIAVLCIVIGFSGAEKGTAEEKYQTVADVLNKYAIQYERDNKLYTIVYYPHEMNDVEIGKMYETLQKYDAKGLMEEIKDNLSANPYFAAEKDTFKIVTTLPLSKASDQYNAYNDLKNKLNSLYIRNDYRIVFDKDENDITDKFFADTAPMHQKDDWGGIIEYFKKNVGYIKKIVDNTNAVPADRIQEQYYLTEIELPGGKGSVDVFQTINVQYNIDDLTGKLIYKAYGLSTSTNCKSLRADGLRGGPSSVNGNMPRESIEFDLTRIFNFYENPTLMQPEKVAEITFTVKADMREAALSAEFTAAEKPDENASDSFAAYDSFRIHLDKFYQSDEQRTVFDKQGKDITAEYFAHTQKMYENNDWNGIITYFKNNVGRAKLLIDNRGDIVPEIGPVDGHYLADWLIEQYHMTEIELPEGQGSVDAFYAVKTGFKVGEDGGMGYGGYKEDEYAFNSSKLEVTDSGKSYGINHESKYDWNALGYFDVGYRANENEEPVHLKQIKYNIGMSSDEVKDFISTDIRTTYSYGIITDAIEIERTVGINATYYFIVYGVEQAYQTSGYVFGVKEGPARFEKTDGSITDIKNLEPFAITSIEGKKAVANGKKYDIAGDVQVYLHRNNTYSVTNLAEVSNNDNYALSGYADGAVRVIIAEKLENMSGYTPVLIKSFDGETMVVDPVEYITTADTERIAELELDPVLDLPSGYYIYNETEESISLKVSGAVFEFVDWNRQFTKPDADLFYETSSAAEFLEYCGTYDGGIPANTPFFLNISGNNLLKLKEIILA